MISIGQAATVVYDTCARMTAETGRLVSCRMPYECELDKINQTPDPMGALRDYIDFRAQLPSYQEMRAEQVRELRSAAANRKRASEAEGRARLRAEAKSLGITQTELKRWKRSALNRA